MFWREKTSWQCNVWFERWTFQIACPLLFCRAVCCTGIWWPFLITRVRYLWIMNVLVNWMYGKSSHLNHLTWWATSFFNNYLYVSNHDFFNSFFKNNLQPVRLAGTAAGWGTFGWADRLGWSAERLNGRWAIESVGGLELAGRFWLGLISWLDSNPAKIAQPNKALNFTIFM